MEIIEMNRNPIVDKIGIAMSEETKALQALVNYIIKAYPDDDTIKSMIIDLIDAKKKVTEMRLKYDRITKANYVHLKNKLMELDKNE